MPGGRISNSDIAGRDVWARYAVRIVTDSIRPLQRLGKMLGLLVGLGLSGALPVLRGQTGM